MIRLDGPGLSCDALRARLLERVEREPILLRRLASERGEAVWVPDRGFSVGRHLELLPDGAIEPAALAGLVAGVFEQRLDREAPLWRIDMAPLTDGGTVLIWRIHHALADGTTAMRLARGLLWDEGEPAAGSNGAASGVHRPGTGPAAEPNRSHAEDERRRIGHLAGFLRREFSDSIHRSPFDGEVGARRTIAFARVPFAPLHDAAKRLVGATINDAVLSIVAGAVRDWVEHHHGSLGAVRFRVPVSLHSEHDDAGNRDSFFTVPVHLEEPDPIKRLRAIHAAAAERKADHDAERLEHLIDSLESRAAPIAGLAKRLEASPRSFALCVSNVPGPRRPLTVLGAPVASLHSVAEVGRRHGLRVAVVSYAGELCFGLCADPAIADQLDAMASGIESQARVLTAAG